MKKFLPFLYTAMLAVATCVMVSTPAFAIPVIDGFLDAVQYNNKFEAGWYNGHQQEYSQFKKADLHMTTVYWESTDDRFYLYLEVPLEAKSMIWGTGVTDEEAELYYRQFSTHHNETLAEFQSTKTDFKTMTHSEKVIFGNGPLKDKDGFNIYDPGHKDDIGEKDFSGVIANLGGKWKDGDKDGVPDDIDGDGIPDRALDVTIGNGYLGLSLVDYADSVDYVINQELCDYTNCGASDIPMAFEFQFMFDEGLTSDEIQDNIAALILDIKTNELEFHLSAERAAPVPEPATMLLLGSGLIGLAVFRRKFKKS